jgi:hypothetical protein
MMSPPFDVETAPPEMLFMDAATRTPKNLHIRLKGTKFEGVASSATEKHRDDLAFIDEFTRAEISEIVQTPAPTVNNGVTVDLDDESVWLVTGTCYITGLRYDKFSYIKAPVGKKLRVTVDGERVELPRAGTEAGSLKGKIVIELEDAPEWEKPQMPPMPPMPPTPPTP